MRPDYGGMTVNERLHASGTMEAFDAAVSAHDVAAVLRLLQDIEVDGESIKAILEKLELAE